MNELHVIVGLGVTGLSCCTYLSERHLPFMVMDTRWQPPYLSAFQKDFPNVPLHLGSLNSKLLSEAAKIILSPGVSLSTPEIDAQKKRGIPVIGDVELFAQVVNSPVIAVTGTNAKSTVTTLVGEMAKACGARVEVGGNLGVPVLQLFKNNPIVDLFVLELSSFQLETTFSLKPKAAAILNITPDHMDRYLNMDAYKQAKHRIYHQTEAAITNRDDPLTECSLQTVKKRIRFTLQRPGKNEFGLLKKNEETYLAFEEMTLIKTKDLPLTGKHFQANALAALALGHAFGLPLAAMLQALQCFKGLPHRCQFLREYQGVKWFNDSKGTNVGATLAAIQGLGSEISGKLILIAGGVGKSADFTPLVSALEKYGREVILIGEAANELATALKNHVKISFARTMREAVNRAMHAAMYEDCVLLSPACASFDMFNNFEHRGQVFTELVTELEFS